MRYLVLILIFSISKTWGQEAQIKPIFKIKKDTFNLSSIDKYIIKSQSLSLYIGDKIQNDFTQNQELSKLCCEGESFIKFTVESDGNISNISAIAGTPKVLTLILQKNIESTINYWILPQKEAKGIIQILPLKYRFSNGCPLKLDKKSPFIKTLPKTIKKEKVRFEDGTFLKNYPESKYNFLDPFTHFDIFESL